MLNRRLQILKKTVTYLRANVGFRKQPLAYVGGWLGHGNLGDEALLLASKLMYPGFSVWYFDGSRTYEMLLNRLPLTRQGVFGGGTLINRCPEYLDLARTFVQKGRQLSVFGTGVADPEFWVGRDDFQDMLCEWKPLLAECRYLGVRGPRSAELLMEVGLEGVEVVGDPVLIFASENQSEDYEPLSLGLNIGFNHGHQWGEESHLFRQFTYLADLARTQGWRVKWFVVYPGDLEITRSLASESGTAQDIYCCYDDPVSYIEEVRRMSAFVGMKLHATALALCGYVPAIMVEYDPKCMDFMLSVGQGPALMRSDSFKAEKAWEMVRHFNSDRATHSALVRKAVITLRQLQMEKALALSTMFTK